MLDGLLAAVLLRASPCLLAPVDLQSNVTIATHATRPSVRAGDVSGEVYIVAEAFCAAVGAVGKQRRFPRGARGQTAPLS